MRTVLGLVLSLLLVGSLQAYTTYAKWGTGTATVYLNPTNADVSASAALAALQVGMDVWTNAGAKFAFTVGGTVGTTTTGLDNRNVVLFRNAINPTNSSAIASTYSWWSSGKLLDSDIIFWDGKYRFYTGTSGCSSGAYIEDIAAHEFGHMAGLQHSSVSVATMYPRYSSCSQTLRTLDADDIAGLKSLYGATTTEPPSPPPPPPPSGTPSLVAQGKDSEGLHQVLLVWSRVPGTLVDIYRNSVLILTTPNDGAHTDRTGEKGPATYVYQVCSAGTTTCTNTVTVTF